MTARFEPIVGRYMHLDLFGRPHRIYVEQAGEGACHTGRRSCFYRVVAGSGQGVAPRLEPRDADRLFDPAQVYGS